MAAEVLARDGFEVTIYDHKPSLGRKFLLAGRGGLNITNDEPIDSFLDRYGGARPRLEAAIADFGPAELRAWCAGLGEPTFVGSSGRVFPASFRATPLLRAWLARLDALGVHAVLQHRWSGFDDVGLRFTDPAGDEFVVESDVAVFALGGASWPRVGADGGWVEAFQQLGLAITPLAPANGGVEVAWSEPFIERFAGAPIKNAAITVDAMVVRGDPIVTTQGLEGGPIYAHSAALRQHLADEGTATLRIDLWPDLDHRRLTERLAKRRPKSSTSTWLRNAGFTPLGISLLREATQNQLPNGAEEVAELARSLPIRVTAMRPIDRAISTAGGVSLDEVDALFMLHKRPGVYVVGEMLDWEAPTGGYLLQACFSTAVAAARSAASWVQSGNA